MTRALSIIVILFAVWVVIRPSQVMPREPQLPSGLLTARVISSQPIPVDSEYPRSLPFDVLQYDTIGTYNPATPTRLTALAPCIYIIEAGVSWQQPVSGRLFIYLKLNSKHRLAITEGLEDTTLTITYPLQTGDYVEVWAYVMGQVGDMVIAAHDQKTPTFAMTCVGRYP